MQVSNTSASQSAMQNVIIGIAMNYVELQFVKVQKGREKNYEKGYGIFYRQLCWKGHGDGGIVDYTIGEDFLWIHLYESGQLLYDGKCLQKTMNALNTLLRKEIFDRFEAWGMMKIIAMIKHNVIIR